MRQQRLIDHKCDTVVAADNGIKLWFPLHDMRQNLGGHIAIVFVTLFHVDVGQRVRINARFQAGSFKPATTTNGCQVGLR